MSEMTYRQLVAELAGSGNADGRTKRDIREEIVHLVTEAWRGRQPWAGDVMGRWQREGAERDYERAHAALNTTVYVTASGIRKRKTTSYSTPRRSADSGDVAYVQASFWDYDRPAFARKREEIVAQSDRLTEVVTAMELVLDAWSRHPNARTAREAWLADGRSLGEIDLTQAGVA